MGRQPGVVRERQRRPRRHLQPGTGQRAAGSAGAGGPGGGGRAWRRPPGRGATAGSRGGAGAGGRMQPGRRAGRRAAPRPAVGPPPARARLARCSNFTRPRGCGVRPAPAIPRAAARPGAERERGRDPAARAAAARTHLSAVPPPGPGPHSGLHGPAAPGCPAPRAAPPARSGARDAASGRATAAATPLPAGARRRGRGLSPAQPTGAG